MCRPSWQRAFDGDARPDDLRQAVDVEGLDAGCPPRCAGAWPRSTARRRTRPTRSGSSRMSTPSSPRALDQVQEVARRAADGRDAEILHDHDLPVGVAAGDGDDGRAERLGAVMRAQPAGEQPVAVGVLDDVAAGAGRRRRSCGPSRSSRRRRPPACRPRRSACRWCRSRRAAAPLRASGWRTGRTG